MSTSRFGRLIRSDFGKSFTVAIIWQVVFITIATVSTHVFGKMENYSMPHNEPSFLYYMLNWDGEWYKNIINGSYFDKNSPSPAFFPAYPLILWLVSTLSFGLVSLPIVVLLVNTLAMAGAIYFIKRISSIVLPTINAWIAPLLFLVSPAAIFMNVAYTESLLCVIGFGAYYLALRRNWLGSCIMLAIATGTKLAGILFIGLCFLEYMRAHDWNIRRSLRNKSWLYFLITPLGFILYAAFLQASRGDALSMFHSIQAWTYHQFNPNFIETIITSAGHVVRAPISGVGLDNILLVNFVIPLLLLGLTLFASLYAFYRLKNIPLGTFGIVSIVFFTLNNNLVSVHRYLLPVLVVYLVLSHLVQGRGAALKYFIAGCAYASVLLQSILIILFSTYNFAG